MSFSFTLFEKEITSTLSTAVDEKIAENPNEQSRKEAGALSEAIVNGIQGLAEGNGEFGSAYVSGSVTAGQTAQLTISVKFLSTEQKRQAEEQALLRQKADTERAEAEKARAAVQAQGPRKADAAKKA